MLKKKLLLLSGICLNLLLGAGCGKADYNDAEQKLVGKWGYLHEPKDTILAVKDDGTAQYRDRKWSFSADETTITLTSEDDTKKLLYAINPSNEDQMLLYQEAVYTYMDGEQPDGVLGYWLCESDNWEFEFTEYGTFREDGSFTGYFYPDIENGVMKLVYENGMLEDTTFYFSIDGKYMTVIYPWKMVRP